MTEPIVLSEAELLSRIEAYASENGIACSTVTGAAVDNSRLYSRMMSGGGCTLESAKRLLAFMATPYKEHLARRRMASVGSEGAVAP